MENEMIVIDLSEKTARPPLKFITHARMRCATACPKSVTVTMVGVAIFLHLGLGVSVIKWLKL